MDRIIVDDGENTTDESPGVLLHVSSQRMLEANAALLSSCQSSEVKFDIENSLNNQTSVELHYFTSRLLDQGWWCYWYVLEDSDVDPLNLRNIYDVRKGCRVNLNLETLNREVDIVVARILGSVEGKAALISRYFSQLHKSFTGVTVNNPKSVIYGLRKDYLLEFAAAGVHTIPNEYFENTVNFRTLESRYTGRMKDYILKPVTGELSDSLAILQDVDEAFLRRKESKVGGWLVQPYVPEVWNGEYQLFFIGDDCTHAIRKSHHQSSPEHLLPDGKKRVIEPYLPSSSEVAIALRLRDLWEEIFGFPNDLFRMDFFKQDDGEAILLEFETVNPGFFMRYSDESCRRETARVFEEYLKKCQNKVRKARDFAIDCELREHSEPTTEALRIPNQVNRNSSSTALEHGSQ